MVAAAVAMLAVAAFVFQGKIRAFRNRNYIEVPVVNGANWFDYPVGAPNARGYYRAQRFGGADFHLGEDWNGIGGGNSDYGDPVYSVALGVVSYAEHYGLGWGNVVRIIHPVDRNTNVEAVYAHLAEMKVQRGEQVRRGQVIGTIGDAEGSYMAHLHFEIRTKTDLPLGGGYGRDPEGAFVDPTKFISAHRKKP
jgi:murein DD-endopeptidase MepM/ murein hydrolase activator NlpD